MGWVYSFQPKQNSSSLFNFLNEDEILGKFFKWGVNGLYWDCDTGIQLTLSKSKFKYSICSHFRWKFEVRWRLFALLFNFQRAKRTFRLRFCVKSIILKFDSSNIANTQNIEDFFRRTFRILITIHVQTNRVSAIYIFSSSNNSMFTSLLSD